MTIVDNLAAFVTRASYDQLSKDARERLKIHILDSLACAIGAAEGEPIKAIREHIADFGGAEKCTMIGGGKTSPDRAAFYNGALTRYLDYNDSYLAKGETCHPSDNIGAVLAACEYAGGSGKDLMTAIAVAYQVHCRLCDVAPVRHKGFDHTVQGSYGASAGVAKGLRLDAQKTANAIAIAGTAFNALRVTRTGVLSNWKGLAMPNTGFCATHAGFLAMRGITGPGEVFEGNKGFMDLAGKFELDWSKENLEKITGVDLKKYNAECHSQSAIEGALDLKVEHKLNPADIDRAEIDIFDVAFHIIGGGEEGSKINLKTKEEADHSLVYMVAVGLLDDFVGPPQYEEERIAKSDVQQLLRKFTVRPHKEYSNRFPHEHACKVTLHMKDGRSFSKEKNNYEGFHTNPMKWDTVTAKFDRLTKSYVDANLRKQIIDAVTHLEDQTVAQFVSVLAKTRTSAA